MEGDEVSDITCLCLSKHNPDILYIAYGNRILVTNLNDLPAIIHQYAFNEDEVNAIALNHDESYLSACDDSGQIKVIDLDSKRLHKTLRKHSNICTSVRFIPQRKKELISGGCDNNLIRWDFTKNRAFCIIDMKDFSVANADVDAYLVSPPFIHSIDITSSGDLIACATENALVQLFDCVGHNTTFRCTLKAHSQSVSQVHFTNFSGDENPLLFTGGNDGMIYAWELKNCKCRHVTNGNAAHKPEEPAEFFPESFFAIHHGEKINWISSLVQPTDDQRILAVADNTNAITLYNIQDVEH